MPIPVVVLAVLRIDGVAVLHVFVLVALEVVPEAVRAAARGVALAVAKQVVAEDALTDGRAVLIDVVTKRTLVVVIVTGVRVTFHLKIHTQQNRLLFISTSGNYRGASASLYMVAYTSLQY